MYNTQVSEKKCSKCGQQKTPTEFSDGRNQCKACRNASSSISKKRNADYYHEYDKRRYEEAKANPVGASVTGSKTCYQCKETKSVTEFHRGNARSTDGRQGQCSDCHNAVETERYRAQPYNPQKRREQKLRHNYGITLDDYQQMYDRQQGCCAICGSSGTIKALSVDHDHTTGRIRELLCHLCNSAIGYFLENPSSMRAAAKYIERHTTGGGGGTSSGT